jgi:hypothetical protein
MYGQETNSQASGRIILDNKETPVGITVILTHEPTQTKYQYITHQSGNFHFFNIKPGGPYQITISAVGFKTLTKKELHLPLGGKHLMENNHEVTDFPLQTEVSELPEVVLRLSANKTSIKAFETTISRPMIESMPSINRSLHDYARLVPQARVTGEGAISLAGQNNRFNAFFIDGANHNDIQGLAANGLNGGQTGSPPLSIESIEAFNIKLAPYNAQFGNFTGGSINAITRSGSNLNKSAAWYYFRNENMAGRSPEPIEKPGSPGEYYRPLLTEFLNQTFGFWNSGAIVKNKLFYFALLEKQSELWPQPYNMDVYQGNSDKSQLFALSNFVKNEYGYDPGSFLETKDQLDATRLNLKLDLNASVYDQFMLSYRYNNASRTFLPRPSGTNVLYFQNSGVHIPATTHSASFEWKHFFKGNMNNRLLLSFTNQEDDRQWLGDAFPSVSMFDGSATVSLGSETTTGMYELRASNFSLFNVFTYIRGRHVFTIGTDIDLSRLDNRYLPAYFGSYNFNSVNDFLTKKSPSRFSRFYPFAEETGHPTRFQTLRTSVFVNDEFRSGTNLIFNAGLRLDVNSILSTPTEDKFFNESAIPIVTKYYELDGAKSGQMANSHWALSPRFSMDYFIPKLKIDIKAGAGIFVGHIVNIWPSDIFNSINGSLDIRNMKEFIPDPYGQPTAESLNLDPEKFKGNLNLISKKFKFPSVLKTSVNVIKKLPKGWTFSVEAIYTKNLQETSFRNVNIMPPAGVSMLPDSRNVYSTSASPAKIPLMANGVNPYSQVLLLTNNHDKKGNSYSISFIVQKYLGNFSLSSSYTYGKSRILFEITGPQTPMAAQWRNMETVNGRNYTTLSISDNDLRHRITTWASYKFSYAKGRTATTVSLFYNGQSGSPYSYVYLGSLINDNGNRENTDLIYIPTEEDLSAMHFVPFVNNGVNFSEKQQKTNLNKFIENDKFLSRRRGQFSERNGARLPFTHTIDLHIQQEVLIKTKAGRILFTLTYDVFNFTNMINKNWGRIYYVQGDSYPLIEFAGFASTSPLTPQYRFRSGNVSPYSLQNSTVPGNSARWISQLGIKIGIN